MLAKDLGLEGITTNALVIGDDPAAHSTRQTTLIAEMVAYFQRHVIRGPGAFVEVAFGFEGFVEAMRRKLLREIRVLEVSDLTNGPH